MAVLSRLVPGLPSLVSYRRYTTTVARAVALLLAASLRPSAVGRYQRGGLDRRDLAQQDQKVNLIWRNECQRAPIVKTAIMIIITHRRRARQLPHARHTVGVIFGAEFQFKFSLLRNDPLVTRGPYPSAYEV